MRSGITCVKDLRLTGSRNGRARLAGKIFEWSRFTRILIIWIGLKTGTMCEATASILFLYSRRILTMETMPTILSANILSPVLIAAQSKAACIRRFHIWSDYRNGYCARSMASPRRGRFRRRCRRMSIKPKMSVAIGLCECCENTGKIYPLPLSMPLLTRARNSMRAIGPDAPCCITRADTAATRSRRR